MSVIYVALITLLINIPMGYWRESVKKFSPQWFVAVHAAVPIVIIMRNLAGIQWEGLIILFLVVSYFIGQTIGARLKRQFSN